MRQKMRGGEALALGALTAGVSVATSYPGSPSSEVIEELIKRAPGSGIVVEWASNERVALETAIGVSIAGGRALVCTKSVGMNVMLDPLMVLNITPVHGGLVIVLGDDPGGYGSQNDQDTRPLARLLELPMLEPATPADAFAMIVEAFELSERFTLPIILRETRSFAQASGTVEVLERASARSRCAPARESWRFVPVPSNAVAKHRALRERLEEFAAWQANTPYFGVSGVGEFGVLACGFAEQKLADVLSDSLPERLSVARLGLLHPLPADAICRWLKGCREIMVIEESQPFVEHSLLAIAQAQGLPTRILGKATGHLLPEGELFRWQIREALLKWQPDLVLAKNHRREDEAAERPARESYCTGCRYGEVLDVIAEVARARDSRPFLVGDPGCLVTVADRLDAKYAIGSAIGVAHGLHLGGVTEKVVALFGDSAFFHSAIPALCHAVVARSPILMIVLDNQSTRTSGNQPHPGVGVDALGRPAPKLSIERIARACDVADVRTVPLDRPPTLLRDALDELWDRPTPVLIVVEIPQQ